MSMQWYCVQVSANREKSFRKTLQDRIESAGDEMRGKFGDIFSPTEQMVEMKKGKRYVSQRTFFPNYIFIKMEMDPSTWHLVNRLPMTKGFVGETSMGDDNWREPHPVSASEIEEIRSRVSEGEDKPRPKVMFEIGESVRIKEGPFTNFAGNVNDVNYESSRISVSVNVFNRPTEIQIDFEQVEKM